MSARDQLGDVLAPPLLEALQLTKVYVRGQQQPGNHRSTVALNSVSLALLPGSILALIGRSGSGKSTLARCLALLETPDSGEVRFQGVNVDGLSSRERKIARRSIQLVWQHSALALNPRFRALDIVAEPLRILKSGSKNEQRDQALAMMVKLELSPALASHTPDQLSGGQRQRLAIGRALMMNPTVLIFDEALAGLDLPLQRQIIALLLDLKGSLSLSYVFVFHDLRMAASLSDKIAVMEDGRIVEVQTSENLIAAPQHSATRELVRAIPPPPFSKGNHPGNC